MSQVFRIAGRESMSDKPTEITIRCQGCKQRYKPKEIIRVRGVCDNCPTANWHIQAEYRIYNSKSGGVLGSDSLPLGNVGINVLGLGLLAATGTGFVVTGGDSSGAGTKSTWSSSIADIYDVPSLDLVALCEPIQLAAMQLAEFVNQKELEIQRTRMAERGATHCRSCNVLFVPSAAKPWFP